MNAGPIDLFVLPSIANSVLRDRETILRYGEFRRKQFDPVITAHTTRFKRHDFIAEEAAKAFLHGCDSYLGETVRQILAAMCTSKARTNVGYEVYNRWVKNLCTELKACYAREDAAREEFRKKQPKLPPFDELRLTLLRNFLNPPPAANEVDEFYHEFCRTLETRLGSELLWLSKTALGYPVLNRSEFQQWLLEPAKDLAATKEITAAYQEQETEHRAASWRIERKILNALWRLTEPFAQRIDEAIANHEASFITVLMMKLYPRLHAQFAPNLYNPCPRHEPIDYDYFGTQIVLQYHLQEQSYDWQALAEAFAALVEAPRLFARWPCTPEKQPVKSLLRHFTELFTGPVFLPVEREHLLTRLRAPDACREEVLTLTCEYLGLLCAHKEIPARMSAYLDPIVTGYIDNMPGWMERMNISERKYRLMRSEDVEFAQLVAEEKAAKDDAARLQANWGSYRPECPQQAAEPATTGPSRMTTLNYVENLGAELWRTHKIECPREDLAVTLDFHRIDSGIDTVVPISSIARAIDHYLYEMTPEQRQLVQMERISGENWRKLKRGGQRIYILEKDGEVFIHLLKRKDWVIASEQEARY